DRVGQNLSALAFNLDVALGALGDSRPEVTARINDSAELLRGTLQAIESVMADLRPPLLEEYGLGAALQRHVEQFARRSGIACEFVDNAKEGARSLRIESAVALFRVAQEALNNV